MLLNKLWETDAKGLIYFLIQDFA